MTKYLFTAIVFLTLGCAFAQEKQCFCESDTLMKEAIDCKTILLQDKSKLYWQYNCNRIWLTLADSKGKKTVLDELEVALYGYTYRLGYQLVKEFDSTILFRSGCPANGPCVYNLIDKKTGAKIKEFSPLIGIETNFGEEKKYPFDFVVYFNKSYDKLKIYYINSQQTLTIPFDAEQNNLIAPIPEQLFEKMNLQGNILTLYYTTNDDKELKLKINLTDKKYKNNL